MKPAMENEIDALCEPLAALKERADALALQADEWEGKYAIVSEQNAALKARVEALEGLARMIVDASELAGLTGPLSEAAREVIAKGTPHAE